MKKVKKFSKKERYQFERLYLTYGEVLEDPDRPRMANYIHRQVLRYYLLENHYLGKPLGALCELFLEGHDGEPFLKRDAPEC